MEPTPPPPGWTPLLVRYVPSRPSDFLKRHAVEALVLWLPVAIFAIMGAVRAGSDREWRYPVTIRWIRQP